MNTFPRIVNAVAVFAKSPSPGKAKVRLAKFIGAEEAAKLQHALFEDNLSILDNQAYALYIAYPESDEDKFTHYNLPLIAQGEGDLGQKMHRVLQHLLTKHDKVALVASDTVNLDQTVVEQAFDSVTKDETVAIAPAEDGGFGLIAMQKFHDLFETTNWYKYDVFDLMKQRIAERQLVLAELSQLNDLDTIEELKKIRNFLDIVKYERTNQVLLNHMKEW